MSVCEREGYYKNTLDLLVVFFFQRCCARNGEIFAYLEKRSLVWIVIKQNPLIIIVAIYFFVGYIFIYSRYKAPCVGEMERVLVLCVNKRTGKVVKKVFLVFALFLFPLKSSCFHFPILYFFPTIIVKGNKIVISSFIIQCV